MKLIFKRLYVILILAGLLFSCGRKPKVIGKHQDTWQKEAAIFLDSLSRIYAPDKRDRVFEWKSAKEGDTLVFGITLDSADVINDVRQAIQSRFPKARIDFKLLPLSEWKNKVGVVRLSVANLRTKPKHTAELASQMLMGMPVKILEKRDGFYRVRTTEGYLGWTDLAALKIMDREAFAKWLSKPKIIVQETCVSVLQDTLMDSPQVSDMVFNDVAILLSKGEYFYRIELPDGRKGFIPVDKAALLDEWNHINENVFDIRDLTAVAVDMFTGVPYLWGGTSAKAFDCSGFTKNIYQNFGFLLPRDASQQYKTGKEISVTDEKLKEVQPGDLLFFGQKREGKPPKVTHVALYLGNGRIVHATGEVKVESLISGDSLFNEERRKTLLGARRIAGYYDRKIMPYYIGEAVKIYFPESR